MTEMRGKWHLGIAYLGTSLHLFWLRLLKAVSGIIIGLLILALTLAAMQTLLGQLVIWIETGDWLQLPMHYWFVYPWTAIAEDISMVVLQKHVDVLVNPFITLGVVQFTVDPDTFMPAEGSYWPTYAVLEGFAQWLATPDRWLTLHSVIVSALRCPISLFLVLVILLFTRSSRHYFDGLQRRIFHLHVVREKQVLWLKELISGTSSVAPPSEALRR